MERIICLVIGYACGLVQTGYLYGKWKHIDIRKEGSGNAGMTNALRTLGFKAGLITFLGDFLKCLIAIGLVMFIFRNSHANTTMLLKMYAGMGAVLGHNYPFYLNFKGGKGIAVTAAVIFTTSPVIALIELIVFIVVVSTTKYVSLASLIFVLLYEAELILFGQNGAFLMSQNVLTEMYIVGALFVISAFYMHRANIKRLINGTENEIHIKR